MRVFFIGTVLFSEKTLGKLLEMKVNIVGAATKQNSEINADYANLTPILENHSIPYKYVNDINHPNNVAFIRDCKPDVIFCFGWSSLLKSEILNLSPLGVIGFHPAKLPDNKGRHPLIWALVLGLKNTANSFFFMDEGADTGDILSQKDIPILETDSAADLYLKVVNTALEQIETFVPQLESGKFPRIKQNPNDGNTWRKRGKNDGKIDFRMNSTDIYNLVRALSKPYPGAHIEYNSEDYKVWEVKIEPYSKNNIEPGKILNIFENQILVKTADSAVWLCKHEINIPDKIEYFR